MSLSVVIAGTNRNSAIAADTPITIQRTLGESWTCEIGTVGDWYPSVGETLVIEQTDPETEDTVIVFGGVIRSVRRYKESAQFPWLKCSVSATDYNHILERRLTGEREWATTTDNAIATDYVTGILASEGITSTLGSAADVASFRTSYDTVAGSLTELAKLGEKRFWVDAGKVLHFIAPVAGSAPFDIPSAASNIATLEVTETDEDYVNVVVVRSNQTITATDPESFVGDGSATTFELTKAVATEPTITVNDVAVTVGVYGVDTGRDWYWEQGSKQIRQDEGGTVLTSSDTLVVTYQAVATVYAIAENVDEIGARAEKEGGTGRYEKLFEVDRLLSEADAQSQANAILAERSTIPLQATYTTSDAMEPAAKFLQPGQVQSIMIDGWGSQQTTYLIRSVSLSSVGLPDSNDWQFSYTVDAFYGSVTKTLFQWFKELSGGPAGGGGVGGGATWYARAIINESPLTTGTDKTANRYRLLLKSGTKVALYSARATAKTAPSTGMCRVSLYRSPDLGAWSQVLAVEIASGQNSSDTLNAFDLPEINAGDYLRVDIEAANGAEGVELAISGREE